MSEENLMRMGIETYINDHGTPDEHYEVSLEITGIPKLLCMILNDEHQYTTCERSLRYTKVKPNEYITELEVQKYNKWYDIFVNIFKTKYGAWFYKYNQNDEEKALNSMGKMAQENARNFVSVLTPTSISYTAPWYQWQKIGIFLMEMVQNPQTKLEKLAAPYARDFVEQLIDLKVIVLTKDAVALCPLLKEKLTDNREWLYRNNKGIKLSLFAENNLFSGINKPNDFGSVINYNSYLSISAIAQGQRHRTADWEIQEPDEFMYVIPDFIKNTPLENEYIKDMLEVKKLYPQAQVLKANVNSSLKNVIYFMGQERACERAQQEIENWYVNKFVPDIVTGLEKRPEYEEEYILLRTKYLNRCRCAYPTYNCPNPCGHPRPRRPF